MLYKHLVRMLYSVRTHSSPKEEELQCYGALVSKTNRAIVSLS